MGSYVSGIFYIGCNRWLAKIALMISLFISFNISATSSLEDLEPKSISFMMTDECYRKAQFDNLEKTIEGSKNTLEDVKKFLDLFLLQIESDFGIVLTIDEACQLVKDNLHMVDASLEIKNSILLIANSINSNAPTKTQEKSIKTTNSEISGYIRYGFFPNGWGYLIGRKKQNNFQKSIPPLNALSTHQILQNEPDLPDSIYIGAVEAFAGALLCIIPEPNCVTVGIGMILDGGRRVFDGLHEINETPFVNKPYQNFD